MARRLAVRLILTWREFVWLQGLRFLPSLPIKLEWYRRSWKSSWRKNASWSSWLPYHIWLFNGQEIKEVIGVCCADEPGALAGERKFVRVKIGKARKTETISKPKSPVSNAAIIRYVGCRTECSNQQDFDRKGSWGGNYLTTLGKFTLIKYQVKMKIIKISPE